MRDTINFKGFSAGINLPRALSGEQTHGLPPYAPATLYQVADYPDAPADWDRGNDMVATYFVGVPREERGMWIDLTGNQHGRDHIAAIPSIQGVNALTALPVDQQPVLEQYKNRCPVHGTRFTGNRNCHDCGFDWPAQNYLSTATGKMMWIDGFRTKGSNGKPGAETRQFLFTSDTSRGIAAQVLGEDRSFDIVLHFYRGPQKPPQPKYRGGLEAMELESAGGVQLESLSMATRGAPAPEIAAGARIRQDIGIDPLDVNEYGVLEATVRIYYTYEDVISRIIQSGRTGEGGLTGLKVGHPAGGGHQSF